MKIAERIPDQTGATKFVLTTIDDHRVEATAFVAGGVENICVSCQVGCSYTCRHCATGKLGLGRNLSAQEMFEQVELCKTAFAVEVLFMGMGEPFANLRRVLETIDMLVRQGIINSARQAHIATSGIGGPGWKTLKRLKDRPIVSISIHAGSDYTRKKIIPHAIQFRLNEIAESVHAYKCATGDQVFFNYTPLKGVNDSLADYDSFCQLVRELDCIARITPFNAWPGSTFLPADDDRVELLVSRMKLHGVEYLLRPSRGVSVLAGCGQLGAIA